MPTIWRTIDVNEKVAKDEIKRFDDYRTAISQMDLDRVGRYDPDLAKGLEGLQAVRDSNPLLANATPKEMAKLIVKSGGGPPANPLSSFVTV